MAKRKRNKKQKNGERQLYFAFGSNMNHEQMRMRCPRARFVGRSEIPDSALVFRCGLADAVPRNGSTLYGGIWSITAACEITLDRYEGVGSGLYLKDYVRCRQDGRSSKLLIYRMADDDELRPPGDSYLRGIIQGFDDCGLADRAEEVLRAAQEAENDFANGGRRQRARGRAARKE